MASIDVLRTIPAVALVPVAVLSFGPTVKTEVILATYAALWPVIVNTAGGVAAVHPRQYDVARMLRFSPATTVRKIVAPAVLPAWLVGARMAVIVGFMVAIVAEMLLYTDGLGGGLIESFNALSPARVWAYTLVCGVIGFVLTASLRHVVRIALHRSLLPVDRIPVSISSVVIPPAAPASGLTPCVALLAVWQRVADDDSLSFPPPSQWLAALARLLDDGLLIPAVIQTLATYTLGLGVAAVVGTALGGTILSFPRLDQMFTPTIDFIAAVPAAALLPAAVLLLGPSQLAAVLVVALIVSWPIQLNVAMAARSIPVVRLEMARTLGLSPAQRWAKVTFPSLSPGLMLGLRVASALALIVSLLVGIFGSGDGIGRLLVVSQQTFDSGAAWGLLAIVAAFGYLSSAFLGALARRQITAYSGAAVTPTTRARLTP